MDMGLIETIDQIKQKHYGGETCQRALLPLAIFMDPDAWLSITEAGARPTLDPKQLTAEDVALVAAIAEAVFVGNVEMMTALVSAAGEYGEARIAEIPDKVHSMRLVQRVLSDSVASQLLAADRRGGKCLKHLQARLDILGAHFPVADILIMAMDAEAYKAGTELLTIARRIDPDALSDEE
jgi:hypothetical protein